MKYNISQFWRFCRYHSRADALTPAIDLALFSFKLFQICAILFEVNFGCPGRGWQIFSLYLDLLSLIDIFKVGTLKMYGSKYGLQTTGCKKQGLDFFLLFKKKRGSLVFYTRFFTTHILDTIFFRFANRPSDEIELKFPSQYRLSKKGSDLGKFSAISSFFRVFKVVSILNEFWPTKLNFTGCFCFFWHPWIS